jgi:hypothetical protein
VKLISRGREPTFPAAHAARLVRVLLRPGGIRHGCAEAVGRKAKIPQNFFPAVAKRKIQMLLPQSSRKLVSSCSGVWKNGDVDGAFFHLTVFGKVFTVCDIRAR